VIVGPWVQNTIEVIITSYVHRLQVYLSF